MRISNIDSNLSFQAMKPNQFSGIDYAVVRKFKAPVEKFNSNNDFQVWANALLKKICQPEDKKILNGIDMQRKFALNKWKEFLLNNENYSPAKSLFIFKSMLKNIIPPVINIPILEKTISQSEQKILTNKDKPFDFNKMYQENLAEYYLKDIPKNFTGWIILPSKRNQPDKFEDNIECLKLLSKGNWCTKDGFIAQSYLEKGDFHIFLKDGAPKVAIRFSGVDIQEIQGEKNNMILPEEYNIEVKKHLKEGEYFLNDDIGFLIDIIDRGI